MVDDAGGADQKVQGKDPVLTPHVALEPTRDASEGSIDAQERTRRSDFKANLRMSWLGDRDSNRKTAG
jgi:hypothetical protein